jgi:hypothetical protein
MTLPDPALSGVGVAVDVLGGALGVLLLLLLSSCLLPDEHADNSDSAISTAAMNFTFYIFHNNNPFSPLHSILL